MGEVGDFGRKRLFRVLPEWGGGGEKKWGKTFGGPVGGATAGVAFGEGEKFIDPAEAKEALRLKDGLAPKEVEIF